MFIRSICQLCGPNEKSRALAGIGETRRKTDFLSGIEALEENKSFD